MEENLGKKNSVGTSLLGVLRIVSKVPIEIAFAKRIIEGQWS